MEIRDVVHGAILVQRSELPIIDSKYFQRLRHIKQLGFSEYSFPSASHNRYSHSLGAMETASRAFQSIFGGNTTLRPDAIQRFRAVARLGALLHDIGHGPLSHTTEFAMPSVQKLQVPGQMPGRSGNSQRKATHEDYTLKILLDSEVKDLLHRIGDPHGFDAHHVAALIEPGFKIPKENNPDFFLEKTDGEMVDYLPILQQLISSELDADRMDYLRRDSYHAGVSYGQFDFNWLVTNLTSHIANKKCYLTLEHRALYTFEDFLISRYHMFLMVYFHYKGVVYDAMLAQYFNSPDCDYELPADIERYVECVDGHLYSHLTRSSNEWARRITEKRPYRILVELHSGIPATKSAHAKQETLFRQLENKLKKSDMHHLVATSTGELSKYFRKPGNPIYVRYDNHYSRPSYIPLEKCTDLFERYSEKRSITRLYVSPENYKKFRTDSFGDPLSTPLLFDESYDHPPQSQIHG